MKSERIFKLRKPRSINFVLLKYFSLLAFLLIVLIEIVFYLIVSNTISSSARENLIRTGVEVTEFIYENDDEAISNYMRNSRSEGITVYILSSDGEVLLPDDAAADWSGNIDEVKNRLKDLAFGSAIIFDDGNELTYATTVFYHGENYLVARYSLSIINKAGNTLLFYLIAIGLIALLVSAMISLSVSQRLSSGINDISETAVRFAKGDYEVNFANSQYQELADLSDTLNTVRDEVKKSDEFQRELLANVSHDLKTPLTMIKAYASMISEISGDNPEKREKHLKVIIDEADRLTGLVNDILNVSKVTANLNEINYKVFGLSEFLCGIINKFDYLQETQGYKIVTEVEDGLYTRADEEKIGQVIYNLLGNAVNYTGEDKTVYISLKSSSDGERIKLKIRDTGKGIDQKDLPEIWNRYYRVKENHSRPVKGTGLGLNVVKVILQNHAFDFGVESELGKGSTFWVDFPSVPAETEVK